jgi:hypothetical protein
MGNAWVIIKKSVIPGGSNPNVIKNDYFGHYKINVYFIKIVLVYVSEYKNPGLAQSLIPNPQYCYNNSYYIYYK